jgi:hypothetical protein
MHAEVKVAVIIVFTKYDILFNEYYRKAARRLGRTATEDTIRTDAEKSATERMNTLSQGFQKNVEYVTVSTHVRYPSSTYTSYPSPKTDQAIL